MIDSHAHYSNKKFDNNPYRYLTYSDGRFVVAQGNRNTIFADMKSRGFTGFVEPAIELESNYKMLELCAQNEGFMHVAVGIHPTRTFKLKWARRKELVALVKRQGVVAVGETGLDYHYPRLKQHRLRQTIWFLYQLKLAEEFKLPVILHIRSAAKQAIKILKRRYTRLCGGVVHCFSGDAATAKQYLDMGFHIGIGGMIFYTGEQGDAFRAAIKTIPLDRILLETDAPFVPPVAVDADGNKITDRVRNSSTIIFAVAEKIAGIKGVSVDAVIAAATENTKRLFNI